jgi:hypothetical protein
MWGWLPIHLVMHHNVPLAQIIPFIAAWISAGSGALCQPTFAIIISSRIKQARPCWSVPGALHAPQHTVEVYQVDSPEHNGALRAAARLPQNDYAKVNSIIQSLAGSLASAASSMFYSQVLLDTKEDDYFREIHVFGVPFGQRAILFVYVTGCVYVVALTTVIAASIIDGVRTPELAAKYSRNVKKQQ